MRRNAFAISSFLTVLSLATPALAHHPMGGTTPATFTQGLLSGFGHPVIGLDHLAAVLAVGGIAALHAAGWRLAVGYVVAMMLGVLVHLAGTGLPGAELWVAATVIALGLVLTMRRQMSTVMALGLFAVVGLFHGYALGESIFGAERAPLVAYLIGLAIIQSVIAIAAMNIARILARGETVALRLAGAGIAGFGIATFVQQLAA